MKRGMKNFTAELNLPSPIINIGQKVKNVINKN